MIAQHPFAPAPELREAGDTTMNSFLRHLRSGARLARNPSQVIQAIRDYTAVVNPEAIFFLGNQKSGTTAIAALTARCAGVSATLDLTRANHEVVWPKLWSGELPFQDFLRRFRAEFSRQLVKEPSLSVFATPLLQNFSRNRGCVLVVRDPRDNIRSILNRLSLPGDLADLTEHQRRALPRSWPTVLDGTWFGLAPGNYISQLAQRWNFILDRYDQHRDRITLVRYEDFMADKAAYIQKLVSQLGLGHLVSIDEQVDIQFQPAGDRVTDWAAFFGRQNLSLINEICAPHMQSLGYDISALHSVANSARPTKHV